MGIPLPNLRLSPDKLKTINGALTIAWAAAVAPIMLWFRDYVWVVTFMSVYTIVVDHFGNWLTSRVETSQAE